MDSGGGLEGKVAVVTGGGRGLGEAIVEALAAAGARVVVASRQMGPCEAVAARVGGFAHALDVTNEDSVVALFDACDRTFGRVDVLVNNAGAVGPWLGLAEVAVGDWDTVFAVNVRGTMLCIKHAVPLLKRRGGAIVNIASRAGLRGNPLQSAYSASKFAVIGLTEAAAQELGSYRIRVNAVCPGALPTQAFVERVNARAQVQQKPADALIAEIAGKSALARLAEPAEVARSVCFLASDAAAGTTGAAVKIDAGRF